MLCMIFVQRVVIWSIFPALFPFKRRKLLIDFSFTCFQIWLKCTAPQMHSHNHYTFNGKSAYLILGMESMLEFCAQDNHKSRQSFWTQMTPAWMNFYTIPYRLLLMQTRLYDRLCGSRTSQWHLWLLFLVDMIIDWLRTQLLYFLVQ